MQSKNVRMIGALLLWPCSLVAACASDTTPDADGLAQRGAQSDPVVPTATLSPTANVGPAGAPAPTPVMTPPAPVTPPSPASAGTNAAPPMAMTPPAIVPRPITPPSMMPAAVTPPTMTPPANSMATPPTATPGPDDGDPSKPVVALPDIKCKPANAISFGLGGANFKVDERDVIIDYPCDKHEGAPMTFILNLHGTSAPNIHFYQEGYFSAFKYVNSHNLIIATPSAVDQQWGNNDGGKDLPYLMNVIDWVYKNLGEKFDIRSMWVGGHSWGAMYTATFGCKPELADKVRGLIIMSGAPTMPACASKMSVIDTNAEMDIASPLNQGSTPMSHGCQAPQMNMLGNNTQTLWPGCNKGFVHSNYLMLGKMHADFMDDVVVQSIVDLIRSARP